MSNICGVSAGEIPIWTLRQLFAGFIRRFPSHRNVGRTKKVGGHLLANCEEEKVGNFMMLIAGSTLSANPCILIANIRAVREYSKISKKGRNICQIHPAEYSVSQK